MRENKPKKKKKIPRLPLGVWMGYLFVVTLVVMGVTFSSYVSRTMGEDNASVAGFGKITISEDVGDKYNGRLIVIPGVPIKKDVTVDFPGAGVPTTIFIKITAGSDWTLSGTTYTNSKNKEITWKIAEGWTALDNVSGVFYMNVDANEKLTSVQVIENGEILIPETVTKLQLSEIATDAMELTFKAWAVQTGDSISATWESIKER
jgi:hypothetical protein